MSLHPRWRRTRRTQDECCHSTRVEVADDPVIRCAYCGKPKDRPRGSHGHELARIIPDPRRTEPPA